MGVRRIRCWRREWWSSRGRCRRLYHRGRNGGSGTSSKRLAHRVSRRLFPLYLFFAGRRISEARLEQEGGGLTIEFKTCGSKILLGGMRLNAKAIYAIGPSANEVSNAGVVIGNRQALDSHIQREGIQTYGRMEVEVKGEG